MGTNIGLFIGYFFAYYLAVEYYYLIEMVGVSLSKLFRSYVLFDSGSQTLPLLEENQDFLV